MSFLSPLLGSVGGALLNNPNAGMGLVGLLGLGKGNGGGGGEAASAPQPSAAPVPAPQANAAANGFGKILGVEGAKISSIADSIGKGMNQIAAAGGANQSYAAPDLPQAPIQNHMQLLDDAVIRALLRAFSGRSAQGQIQ